MAKCRAELWPTSPPAGMTPKGTSLVAALPNETKKCAPATAASHKQPPAGRKGLRSLRPLARAMALTAGGLEGRTTSDTGGNDLGLDHQDQSKTTVAHLTTNNTRTKMHKENCHRQVPLTRGAPERYGAAKITHGMVTRGFSGSFSGTSAEPKRRRGTERIRSSTGGDHLA